ncbi:MAG: GIY-YIG nuclease family protein [Magnetococcus sp. WYHC-3]
MRKTREGLASLDLKRGAVYCIRNVTNGKRYVGSAVNVYNRWRRHRYELNKGSHSNEHLLRAWAKHGKKGFLFEIIEYGEGKSLLRRREQYWMDYYKSYIRENGYNLCPTSTGTEVSEETKRKLSGENSSSAKLTWEDVNHIRKEYCELKELFSNENIAKKYKVTGRNITDIIKNRTWVDPEYLYVYFNRDHNGSRAPGFGKRHSKEHKIKISEKLRGENSYLSKLTEEKVREIFLKRREGYSYKKLAEEYGVDMTNISCIIRRKTWKHVKIDE